MTQEAMVIKNIDSQYAEISVERRTACGHDCSNCGGCTAKTQSIIHTIAKNTANAQPGELVTVESSSAAMAKIMALVYILPIFGIFAGYFFGTSVLRLSDMASALAGVAGVFIFYIPAVFYDKHVKRNNSVVYEIIRKH